MSNALFDAQQLHELQSKVTSKGRQDALAVIIFLTDLAAHLDNELFREMSKLTIANSEWSVAARSSYDVKLHKKIEKDRRNVKGHPCGSLTEHAYGVVVSMVKEINTDPKSDDRVERIEHLKNMKRRAAAVFDELLQAAEAVGRGNQDKKSH